MPFCLFCHEVAQILNDKKLICISLFKTNALCVRNKYERIIQSKENIHLQKINIKIISANEIASSN